jgi:hypothetical protein
MPASEAQIKLIARITALEVLMQHVICLACDRDLDEVRAYRERVLEDASETSIQGFSPAASDHLSAELEEALAKIFKPQSDVGPASSFCGRDASFLVRLRPNWMPSAC